MCIGESVMIGGLVWIMWDFVFFMIVVECDEVLGLNLIGLKWCGVVCEMIVELKKVFKEVYFFMGNICDLVMCVLVLRMFIVVEM